MRTVHVESSQVSEDGRAQLTIWLVDEEGNRLTSEETVHEFESLNIVGVCVKSHPENELPAGWPHFGIISDITDEDVVLNGGAVKIPKNLFLVHYVLD